MSHSCSSNDHQASRQTMNLNNVSHAFLLNLVHQVDHSDLLPGTACAAFLAHQEDIDADGLCDEDDNCTNQTAINFADPENPDCIILGCTHPDYSEYNSEATVDDGTCATIIAGD